MYHRLDSNQFEVLMINLPPLNEVLEIGYTVSKDQ